VLLIGGFLVWGSCFSLLYGMNAIGCELGWPGVRFGPVPLQRAVLVAIWSAHLVCFVPLTRAVRRAGNGPLPAAARLATAAASVSTVLIGVPTTVLTTCE
jgi:hypothetical protein